MNNRFFTNISVLFIILICTSNCFSQANENIEFQRVEPNQVPAELMMLSTATKANYEKIKTWQGNIVFQNIVIHQGEAAADILKRRVGVEPTREPNELIEMYEGTREFKIDLENDRIFTHLNRPQPNTYTDPDKECVYTALTKSVQETKVFTSEYQIYSLPVRFAQDGTIRERRAIKQEPLDHRRLMSCDPRNCFSVGMPVWLSLSQLSQIYEYKKQGVETFDIILEKGKTAQNNVVYRVQAIVPGATQPSSMFILKEQMGFNPAYREDRDENGLLVFQITTEFVEIDGIFLPSKRSVKEYKDFGLHRDENWIINTTQVNAAIPDETFSVHGCGLSDGDSFIDEINNKSYVYKGKGKLVEIKKEE